MKFVILNLREVLLGGVNSNYHTDDVVVCAILISEIDVNACDSILINYIMTDENMPREIGNLLRFNFENLNLLHIFIVFWPCN